MVGSARASQKVPEAGGERSFSELSVILRNYYQSPSVRQRMLEFLGGSDVSNVSAAFIAGNDGSRSLGAVMPVDRLAECWDHGLEIERSLWDRRSLIVHLDLEFHSFDHPEAAWMEPERAFQIQESTLAATRKVLAPFGIDPLICVSGRGYHLAWSVENTCRVFRRLANIGRIPPSLESRYIQPCSPEGACVGLEQGRAFSGLGMLLEFVWHRALRERNRETRIPLQPTAIEVGPGAHGREIISLDLSEYGDPMDSRQIRIPFSAYLKPLQFEWLLGAEGARRLLPIFEIPLGGMKIQEAIAAARDADAVVALARECPVPIPDASEPMEHLLDEYEHSELREFHNRFNASLGDWAGWETPFSSLRLPETPRCMRWILDHPNDMLLRPAALQHVVRVLMACNWSPARIAQAIYASYRQDCNWGEIWNRLDPSHRAIFYTRLFAGMVATGSDPLIDFNCVSHQEKGLCSSPECQTNLIAFRNNLLNRSTV